MKKKRKFSRKEKFSFKKTYIRSLIALLFFVVVAIILGFLFVRTDCGTDTQCFNNLASECKKATVKTIENINIYQIESKGVSLKDFKFDKCRIDVEVLSVETIHPYTYNLFKDTKMVCRVPKGEIGEFTKLRDVMKHCHGSLKEALYEKIIREMYIRIVRNLEGITAQANEALREIGL